MRAVIARVLLLAAVLLMPFGMSGASAGAHREHAAEMPMSHCPDQEPRKHALAGGIAQCTMVCSAALPAVHVGIAESPVLLCTPAKPAITQRLHGLEPETVTPPPRHS